MRQVDRGPNLRLRATEQGGFLILVDVKVVLPAALGLDDRERRADQRQEHLGEVRPDVPLIGVLRRVHCGEGQAAAHTHLLDGERLPHPGPAEDQHTDRLRVTTQPNIDLALE